MSQDRLRVDPSHNARANVSFIESERIESAAEPTPDKAAA